MPPVVEGGRSAAEARVAEAIPDLWRSGEDAARLYQLYLGRLQMKRRHQRVVGVCPRIRRYAVRGPGPSEGLFTFGFEVDSLCALGNYEAAWRRLRQREEIVFGKWLDLRGREWSRDDCWELVFAYAPLLFFRERHQLGRALLETALDFWFAENKVRSYDILFHVYNGDEVPKNRCRVTLSHFYARLGRSLRQWRHWEAFVNGFHPRLFRLAGVRRDDLMADPERLREFHDRLAELAADRRTSGVGGGLSDLIESAAKVRKRQAAIQRKRNEHDKRFKSARNRTNKKLRELFPDLRDLSK